MRQADILIVMSPDAYQQFAGQLKPGGLLLYESDLIHPGRGLPPGARALGVPATRLAEELGRRLVLNIVMAGFFAGTTDIVPAEAVEKAVLDSVPKGTQDINLRAFHKGRDYGRALLAQAARPASNGEPEA